MSNALNLVAGAIGKSTALLILAAMPAGAGPIGYAIDFGGRFGTIDLGTGAFVPVGAGTGNTPDGIGGAPGGPFFTVDATSGHLLRIGADGSVTDVGDTGTGANVGPNGVSIVGGLTTGSMFVLDFSNRLFSVNTGTGALSLLGSLALPTQELDYSGNMVTSFNGDATHLYFTLEIAGGPNQTAAALYRIDPGTLAVASVALQGLTSRIIGSGFVNGAYYAFTEAGEIVRIDPNNGHATVVANYDSGVPDGGGPPFTGLFGVVATPEPGSFVMLGAGLAVLAVTRRKSHRLG